MYQLQDNLTARQKSELRRRLHSLRGELAQMQDDLKLEPARPELSSLIVGQANSLWEMLAELNSSSLSGYGKVSPELQQYLDPKGQSLTEQVYEIATLFWNRNEM